MGWAKLEVEFMTEMHPVSEIKDQLETLFRHPSGVPTATIRIVEDGVEVASTGNSDTLESLADAAWAAYKNPVVGGNGDVIQAIKQLRISAQQSGIANIGLKEAKDAIDAAKLRNP
jgi:ribosomal protein L7/L12